MSNLETTTETPDEITPPDDFGAAIMAEFEKREFGTGGAAMADDVGEWDGGATVDASKFAAKINAETIAGLNKSIEAEFPQTGSEGAEGAAETPAATAPEAPAAVSPAAAESSTADPIPTASTSAATAPVEQPQTSADTAPVAGGYTWEYNGQPIAFTDEQVQRGLSLSAWAEQLTEPTRAAMGALEAGQAVAIPRADYDQFQAWRNQQERSTRDRDLAQLDVDPDVAQLIAAQRDEIAQLRGTTSQASMPVAQQPAFGNATANLDATRDAFDRGISDYVTTNGLNAEEAQSLINTAIQANIIPSLMQSNATFNPVTGALLRPADIGQVTRQALDFALVQNPALHTAVIGRRNGSAGNPGNPGTPLSPSTLTAPSATNPAQPAALDPVIAKRARASSLASAPSAAAPPAPRATAPRQGQDLVSDIAADIAAAMGRG